MVWASSRASAMSLIPGNSRRSSMAAESAALIEDGADRCGEPDDRPATREAAHREQGATEPRNSPRLRKPSASPAGEGSPAFGSCRSDTSAIGVVVMLVKVRNTVWRPPTRSMRQAGARPRRSPASADRSIGIVAAAVARAYQHTPAPEARSRKGAEQCWRLTFEPLSGACRDRQRGVARNCHTAKCSATGCK
jgi:hypothetical protein